MSPSSSILTARSSRSRRPAQHAIVDRHAMRAGPVGSSLSRDVACHQRPATRRPRAPCASRTSIASASTAGSPRVPSASPGRRASPSPTPGRGCNREFRYPGLWLEDKDVSLSVHLREWCRRGCKWRFDATCVGWGVASVLRCASSTIFRTPNLSPARSPGRARPSAGCSPGHVSATLSQCISATTFDGCCSRPRRHRGRGRLGRSDAGTLRHSAARPAHYRAPHLEAALRRRPRARHPS